MPCDICSDRESETMVPAPTMRAAVAKGFTPFAEGLIPARLTRLVHADSSKEWTQQTLNGILAQRDWKLCKRCAARISILKS